MQVLYCALVGTFPFNSFLSGFLSTVGVFVLTGKDTHVYYYHYNNYYYYYYYYIHMSMEKTTQPSEI